MTNKYRTYKGINIEVLTRSELIEALSIAIDIIEMEREQSSEFQAKYVFIENLKKDFFLK